MAFNPRSNQGEIISHRDWKRQQYIEEAKRENIKLKAIPKILKPLDKVSKYYMELIKLGTKGIVSKTFHTANLKHVLRIIVHYNHDIIFLKEASTEKVIWDKR